MKTKITPIDDANYLPQGDQLRKPFRALSDAVGPAVREFGIGLGVRTNDYILVATKQGLWIERSYGDRMGEGMQISLADLDKLLNDYFEKNF